ncbi:response regulator of the LytR/AlgR family [Aequorivita sublithincola DSM 14238]|uniref:Response regulator of the LytR/AlgR family n=1 Tax=Aequorivita sublithincola (strain DSM 14238 / LMG 21431 / ACAM 643 / 9-3) TaxID=746697 RepID=I3YSH6_AEQSU|nr:LytTR family transcriptional regulator DNA-binding domain-containing protein [Aequorivita sublithincola]AFL79944.1 response regulator of the LytR/AlgR family [Aequorivita sublithincola DSM 14238]
MIIKCIVVEDEPLAMDIMVDFISQVPFLKLEKTCTDALAAMKILNEKKIDLIFLDIHLPKLKGLEFLSTLKNPPMVIITTAYQEFALKSYDYNVLDYLLKPIEFCRFMVAVQKSANQTNKEILPTVEIINDGLFFTVNKKKARIAFQSIIYIESQRENVKIVTESNVIQTRIAISELEKQLPDSFLRIHRSYIVAKPKIDLVDAQEIEIRGKRLPIGRSYKNDVHSALGIK